jgi:hypothetical protein
MPIFHEWKTTRRAAATDGDELRTPGWTPFWAPTQPVGSFPYWPAASRQRGGSVCHCRSSARGSVRRAPFRSSWHWSASALPLRAHDQPGCRPGTGRTVAGGGAAQGGRRADRLGAALRRLPLDGGLAVGCCQHGQPGDGLQSPSRDPAMGPLPPGARARRRGWRRR